MIQPPRSFFPSKGNAAGLAGRVGTFFLLCFLLALIGCTVKPQENGSDFITATILVDNQRLPVEVRIGETVQTALDKAGVKLEPLDQVSPPTFTILTQSLEITVTRVREEFEVEETVIPFLRQTVRNESLPEGETLMIQPGVNGVQQITYRLLYENNVLSSRKAIKTETIVEAKPEIIMIGVQTPYMPVPIKGKLAYLTAGNAWVMENNTGNRRPLVTTGDLDGRVFSISPDGEWLLFTRGIQDKESGDINSLWIVSLKENSPEPKSLKARNIIHFADWVPGEKRTVVYSTVEPRDTAPGWQANNDLQKVVFGVDGLVLQIKTLVEANEGGRYGAWGTHFAWSPDGKRLAYATADQIGLVDLTAGKLEPVLQVVPLQTGKDWSWVPGLGWSPDHRVLYTVIHSSSTGQPSDEISPYFDLVGFLPAEKIIIPLERNVGMFAYPVPSPYYDGERCQVAFLKALIPEQSDSSRYELVIMDRDGSNRKTLFPLDGSSGVEPQRIAWEPGYSERIPAIALIYQGNLWLIYPENGKSQPVTGDGTISRMDWK